MTQVIVSSVIGGTFPIFIYACDSFGNNCSLVASVTSVTPLPYIITLPPQFDTAPAVGLRLVDSTGCDKLAILLCIDIPPTPKQFQDGDIFLFMNYEIFQFN